MNTIECDELVAANPACQDLMKETRKYHILGEFTINTTLFVKKLEALLFEKLMGAITINWLLD